MSGQISSLSLPSAAPGSDSAAVTIQKGVRYTGRVDTNGPAVWEMICNWLGLDSQGPDVNGLQDVFADYLPYWMTTLPTVNPGYVGAPFIDGEFLAVSTTGYTLFPGVEGLIPLMAPAFASVIEEALLSAPDTPGATIWRNGSFVMVENTPVAMPPGATGFFAVIANLALIGYFSGLVTAGNGPVSLNGNFIATAA